VSEEKDFTTEDLFKKSLEEAEAAAADGNIEGEAEEAATAAEEAGAESAEVSEPGTEESAQGEEAAEGEEPGTEAKEDADEKPEGETAEEDGKADKKLSRRAKKELAKKDEEIANLTDQYRRAMAEFDNYRKRTDKEKAAMYGLGAKDVVEKILPVVDNFERGLSQIPEEGEPDPFMQGMQAIYKQFMTVLDGIGVKPIEAVGKTFDPAFHNAVMHVDDDTLGDNVVVEEFQKGYTYADQIVRYSMVKVAN